MADIIKKSIFDNLKNKYNNYALKWNAILAVADNLTPSNYRQRWSGGVIYPHQYLYNSEKVPVSLTYADRTKYYNVDKKKNNSVDENGVEYYYKTQNPQNWEAYKTYHVGNTVIANTIWYKCILEHTSSTAFSATEQLESYSSSNTYHYGDKVSYESNNYICNVEYTTALPTTSDWVSYTLQTQWEVIQSWVKGVDYSVGDYVIYDGAGYRCMEDHTSGTTFDDIKVATPSSFSILYPSWSSRYSYRSQMHSAPVYGNGVYVYGGSGFPCTYYSTDLINWTFVNHAAYSPRDVSDVQVAYGNGVFVAMFDDSGGSGQYVLSSTDGINWTPHSVSTATEYFLQYCGDRFVITGRGWSKYSLDGSEWHEGGRIELYNYYSGLSSMTYNKDDNIIVVSSTDRKAIFYSTDGAVSWINAVDDPTYSMHISSIMYINGRYWYFNVIDYKLYYSHNLRNWTEVQSSLPTIPEYAIFQASENIMICFDTTRSVYYYSIDGENWNQIQVSETIFSYYSHALPWVANDKLFLSLRDSSGYYGCRISEIYKFDSSKWIKVVNSFTDIAHTATLGTDNNIRGGINNLGTKMLTANTLFNPNVFSSLAFSTTDLPEQKGYLGRFSPMSVFQDVDKTSLAHSSHVAKYQEISVDGGYVPENSSLTETNANTANYMYWEEGGDFNHHSLWYSDLYYTGEMFLAYGNKSYDGIHWEELTESSGSYNINYYAQGNNIILGLGQGFNFVYRSTDGGNTWTASSTFSSQRLNTIGFINGKFVVGGERLEAYYSTDGLTWTKITNVPQYTWHDWKNMFSFNGKLYACLFNTSSWDKQHICSTDGVNWSSYSPEGTQSIENKKVINNQVVDIADGGVYTSDDAIHFTWHDLTSEITDRALLEDVAYGNGMYVAVWDRNNFYKYGTSIDELYLDSTPEELNNGARLCFGGGKMVFIPNTNSTKSYYAKYVGPFYQLTGSSDMSSPQSSDEIIREQDYDLIAEILSKINTTLTSRSEYFSNGYCSRSCQVVCQFHCQLGCQGCNTSQCHNQKCGAH